MLPLSIEREKVSAPFCREPALRVLRTKGAWRLYPRSRSADSGLDGQNDWSGGSRNDDL